MAVFRTACVSMVVMLGACAGTPEQPAAGSGDALSQVSQPEKGIDCMFARSVKDWTSLDDERFILYGLTKSDAYLGTLTIPTPDLNWDIGIAVIDNNRDGLICGGAGDKVAFRDPIIPGPIMIRTLRKLDKDEARMMIERSKGGKETPPGPAGEAPPAADAPDTAPN